MSETTQIESERMTLELLKREKESTALQCLRCGYYRPAEKPRPFSSKVESVLYCDQCEFRYSTGRSWSLKRDPNQPDPFALI